MWIEEVKILLDNCNSWTVKTLDDIAIEFSSPAYIIALASLVNQGIIAWKWDINCTEDIKSYLERCNFFKCIWETANEHFFTGHSNNLTEINIINNDPNWAVLSEMVQKMIITTKKLDKTDESNRYLSLLENTLLTMIIEIVSNVITHSEADLQQKWCMFMMQYYPYTNRLHFAVVDSWIWIEKTMKRAHYKPWEWWTYYMSLALQQHHTWNADLWAWNWLFVCSEIVEKTGSTMEILSHWNYYQKIWQKIIYDYNSSEFSWTLVNVEFNMNAINNDISRLDDMLQKINTTSNDITDMSYYNNLRD